MKTGKPDSSRPPRRRRKRSPYWETLAPRERQPVELVWIPAFSARGMRPIYGRGANFTIHNREDLRRIFGWAEIHCHLNCSMDIWQRKDGRLFVRFHASRKCIDSFSFELIGAEVPLELKRGVLLDESWVPQVVRDEYDAWIDNCLEDPDGDDDDYIPSCPVEGEDHAKT